MPKVKATPSLKKPPARRVASDDFVVIQDGKEYNPHAGEWVEFKGRPSVGDYLLAMEFQRFDPSESQGISDTFQKLIGQLTLSISAWSWTDDQERPYMSPPDDAALRSLSFDELSYLVGLVFNIPKEGERLNGSSLST